MLSGFLTLLLHIKAYVYYKAIHSIEWDRGKYIQMDFLHNPHSDSLEVVHIHHIAFLSNLFHTHIGWGLCTDHVYRNLNKKNNGD